MPEDISKLLEQATSGPTPTPPSVGIGSLDEWDDLYYNAIGNVFIPKQDSFDNLDSWDKAFRLNYEIGSLTPDELPWDVARIKGDIGALDDTDVFKPDVDTELGSMYAAINTRAYELQKRKKELLEKINAVNYANNTPSVDKNEDDVEDTMKKLDYLIDVSSHGEKLEAALNEEYNSTLEESDLISKIYSIQDPIAHQAAVWLYSIGNYEGAEQLTKTFSKEYTYKKREEDLLSSTKDVLSFNDVGRFKYTEEQRKDDENKEDIYNTYTKAYLTYVKQTSLAKAREKIDALENSDYVKEELYNKVGAALTLNSLLPSLNAGVLYVAYGIMNSSWWKLHVANDFLKKTEAYVDSYIHDKDYSSDLITGIYRNYDEITTVGLLPLAKNATVLSIAVNKKPDELDEYDKAVLEAYSIFNKVGAPVANIKAGLRQGQTVASSMGMMESFILTAGIGPEIKEAEEGAEIAVKGYMKKLSKDMLKLSVKAGMITPLQPLTYNIAVQHKLQGIETVFDADGNPKMYITNKKAREEYLKDVLVAKKVIRDKFLELEKKYPKIYAKFALDGFNPADLPEDERAIYDKEFLPVVKKSIEISYADSLIRDKEGNIIEDIGTIESLAAGLSQNFAENLTELPIGKALEVGYDLFKHNISKAGLKLSRKVLGNNFVKDETSILRAKARIKKLWNKPGGKLKSFMQIAARSYHMPYFWNGLIPEMLEEVARNFIPTYGENYQQNLHELTTRQFYTDVLATTVYQNILMGGATSIIGSGVHLVDKNKRLRLKELIKHSYEFYDIIDKALDSNTDFMNLAAETAIRSKAPLFEALRKAEREFKLGNITDIQKKLFIKSALRNAYLQSILTGESKYLKRVLNNIIGSNDFDNDLKIEAVHLIERVSALEKFHKSNKSNKDLDKAFNAIYNYYTKETKAIQKRKIAEAFKYIEDNYKDEFEEYRKKYKYSGAFEDFMKDVISMEIGFEDEGMLDNAEVIRKMFNEIKEKSNIPVNTGLMLAELFYMADAKVSMKEDIDKAYRKDRIKTIKELVDAYNKTDNVVEKHALILQIGALHKKIGEYNNDELKSNIEKALSEKDKVYSTVVINSAIDALKDNKIPIDDRIKMYEEARKHLDIVDDKVKEKYEKAKSSYESLKELQKVKNVAKLLKAFEKEKDDDARAGLANEIVNIVGNDKKGLTKKQLSNIKRVEKFLRNYTPKSVEKASEKEIKKDIKESNPKRGEEGSSDGLGLDDIEIDPDDLYGSIKGAIKSVEKSPNNPMDVEGDIETIETEEGIILGYMGANEIVRVRGTIQAMLKGKYVHSLDEFLDIAFKAMSEMYSKEELSEKIADILPILAGIYAKTTGNIISIDLLRKKITDIAAKNASNIAEENLNKIVSDVNSRFVVDIDELTNAEFEEEKKKEEHVGRMVFLARDPGFKNSNPMVMSFFEDGMEDAVPYENFPLDGNVKLVFDFDYLFDPNNEIYYYYESEYGQVRRKKVKVSEFVKIFGFKSHDEFVAYTSKEENREKLLNQEDFLDHIPVRVHIEKNGEWVPTNLFIGSTKYYNEFTAAQPIVDGRVDINLRRELAEEARARTRITRIAIRDSGGEIITRVAKRRFGEVDYFNEDKTDFNHVSKVFGGNIDMATKSIAIVFFGSGNTSFMDGMKGYFEYEGEEYDIADVENYNELVEAYRRYRSQKGLDSSDLRGLVFIAVPTGVRNEDGSMRFRGFMFIGNKRDAQDMYEKEYEFLKYIDRLMEGKNLTKVQRKVRRKLISLIMDGQVQNKDRVIVDSKKAFTRTPNGLLLRFYSEYMNSEGVLNIFKFINSENPVSAFEAYVLSNNANKDELLISYKEFIFRNLHFPFNHTKYTAVTGEDVYSFEKNPVIHLETPVEEETIEFDDEISLFGSPLKRGDNEEYSSNIINSSSFRIIVKAQAGKEVAMRVMAKHYDENLTIGKFLEYALEEYQRLIDEQEARLRKLVESREKSYKKLGKEYSPETDKDVATLKSLIDILKEDGITGARGTAYSFLRGYLGTELGTHEVIDDTAITMTFSDNNSIRRERMSKRLTILLSGIKMNVKEGADVLNTDKRRYATKDEVLEAVYRVGGMMEDNSYQSFRDAALKLANAYPYRYSILNEIVRRLDHLYNSGNRRTIRELVYKVYNFNTEFIMGKITKNETRILNMDARDPESAVRATVFHNFKFSNLVIFADNVKMKIDKDELDRLFKLFENIKKSPDNSELLSELYTSIGIPLTVDEVQRIRKMHPQLYRSFIKGASFAEKFLRTVRTREPKEPWCMRDCDNAFNPYTTADRSAFDRFIKLLGEFKVDRYITAVRGEKSAFKFGKPRNPFVTLKRWLSGKLGKKNTPYSGNYLLSAFKGSVSDDRPVIKYFGMFSALHRGRYVENTDMSDGEYYAVAIDAMLMYMKQGSSSAQASGRWSFIGYTLFPTMADNKNVTLLKTPVTVYNSDRINKGEHIEALMDVVADELNRLAYRIKNKKELRDSDKIIHAFNFLNTIEVIYKGKKMPFIVAVNDIINSKEYDYDTGSSIIKMFENDIKKALSEFVNKEVDTISEALRKAGTDNMYKRYSDFFDTLEDMVANYVVNQAVNQYYMYSMFNGGIENLYKGVSNIFSFTEKDIFKAIEDGFIDDGITLNDVNSNEDLRNEMVKYQLVRAFDKTNKNIIKRNKQLISGGLMLAKERTDEEHKTRVVFADDISKYNETIDSIVMYYYPDISDEDIVILNTLKSLSIKRATGIATEDDIKQFNKLSDYVSKRFPLAAPYLVNNSTDGSQYITAAAALKEVYMKGDITEKEYKEILKKLLKQEEYLKNGERIPKEYRFTKSEARVFVSKKPVYAGVVQKTEGSYTEQRNYYFKTSSFVLTPEIAENFDNLRKLYLNLAKLEEKDENGIKVPVRLAFKSSVKVGFPNVYASVDELFSENADLSKYTDDVTDDNFFVQVENPYFNGYDGDVPMIVRGSQTEKVILSDGIAEIEENVFPAMHFDRAMLDELGIKPDENGYINGPALRKIMDHLYDIESRVIISQIRKRFRIEDGKGRIYGSKAYIERLHEFLKLEIPDPILEDKYGIEYLVNGRWIKKDYYNKNMGNVEQARFVFPFTFMPGSDILEHKFMAIVRKSGLRRTMPGYMFHLVPEAGFENAKGIKIISRNYDGRLKPSRIENGEYKPAQVFIPNVLRVWNEDEKRWEDLDPNDIEEPILMYSYRTPHSGLMSGQLVEVVGFLPDSAPDVIITPAESTTQIGEDFDNDKRYTFLPVFIKVNGKIMMLNQSEFKKIEVYKYVKEKIDNELKELEDKYNTGDLEPLLSFVAMKKRGEKHYTKREVQVIRHGAAVFFENNRHLSNDKEDMQNLARDLGEIYDKYKDAIDNKKRGSIDELEKISVQNEIHNVYKAVYSSPSSKVQALITRTINTNLTERTVELIRKKKGRSSTIISPLSPVYMRSRYNAGHIGKQGISIHSIGVATNAALQSSGKTILVGSTSDDGIFYPGRIKIGKFDSIVEIGRVTDKHGNHISEFLMESQNVSTDNPTNPLMYERNENEMTIGVFQLMQMLGMEYESEDSKYSYASLFIAQPILEDMYNEYKELRSLFGDRMAVSIAYEKIKKKWELDGYYAKDDEDVPEKKPADSEEITEERLIKELGAPTKEAQVTVLETFMKMHTYANRVAKIGQLINRETKGFGKTFAEYMAYLETMRAMLNGGKYQGLREYLFDDTIDVSSYRVAKTKDGYHFIELLNKKGYKGSVEVIEFPTKEEYQKAVENAEKDGYYIFDDMLVKPANTIARKIFTSISMADKLFGEFNIFNQMIFKNILYNIGIDIEDLDDISEYRIIKIVNAFRDFLQSYGSVDEQAFSEYMFDHKDGRISFARYLKGLLESKEFGSMFANLPVFKDIKIELNGANGLPSIIRLANVRTQYEEKIKIMQMFDHYYNGIFSDMKLPDFNGNEMTMRDMLNILFRVALIQQNNLLNIFPSDFYKYYGITNALHKASNSIRDVVASKSRVVSTIENVLNSTFNDGVIKNNNNSMTPDDVADFIDNALKVMGLKGKVFIEVDRTTGDVHIEMTDTEIEFINNFTDAFYQHNPNMAYNAGSIYYDYGLMGGKTVKMIDRLGILKKNNIEAKDIEKGKVFDLFAKPGYGYIVLYGKGRTPMLFKEMSNGYYQRVATKGTPDLKEFWNTDINSYFKPNNTPYVYREYLDRIASRDENGDYYLSGSKLFTILEGMLGEGGKYEIIPEKFLDIIKLSGVKILVVDDTGNNNYAVYDANNKEVKLSKKVFEELSDDEIVDIIAEETLHAATTELLKHFVKINGIRFHKFKNKTMVNVVAEYSEDAPTEVRTIVRIYESRLNWMVEKYGERVVKDLMKSKSPALVMREHADAFIDDTEDSFSNLYRAADIHEFLASLLFGNEDTHKWLNDELYMGTDPNLNLYESVDVAIKRMIRRLNPRISKGSAYDYLISSLISLAQKHMEGRKDAARDIYPETSKEWKMLLRRWTSVPIPYNTMIMKKTPLGNIAVTKSGLIYVITGGDITGKYSRPLGINVDTKMIDESLLAFISKSYREKFGTTLGSLASYEAIKKKEMDDIEELYSNIKISKLVRTKEKGSRQSLISNTTYIVPEVDTGSSVVEDSGDVKEEERPSGNDNGLGLGSDFDLGDFDPLGSIAGAVRSAEDILNDDLEQIYYIEGRGHVDKDGKKVDTCK